MKKFYLSVLALSLSLLTFVAPSTAKQPPSWEEETTLTKKEINRIVDDIGLTEEELANFPDDVLKELLENNAKKLASNSKTVREEEFMDKNTITPQVALDGGILDLNATAFSVNSDMTGYKKFYLYGSYEWSKSPEWELTDGLSIGFPVTSKCFLPMSSRGKVQQHEYRYCYRPDNNTSAKWSCSTYTTPDDWDPGVGVGSKIDLEAMPSNNAHKGYISQYVYVEKNESGTVNIKFEYGHQTWTLGSVAFAVYPAGFAIEPASVTKVEDFGIVFRY
ncbi:hypothetical protein QNK09_22525 [Brevibacillus agri]|uniref:hypothetical protein n=1 Tax=Brevibacillus agri TaxID=51101 RepID=UPI0024BF114A|nr:hypothetical protein [Brevibacillus agri]WHX29805.1 hypothetical protein QNK09_22525 [Brevibacillus agri]